MNLNGKTAIVTGAANGIGLAVAERLLAEGMNLVAVDIEGDDLSRLPAAFEEASERIELVNGDVSVRAEVASAIARAIQRFESLDVFVANAGIADAQPFLEIDDDAWKRVIDVNLTGTFHCIQEAARVMTLAGKGSIVVTSSTNAFYVETNLAPYNASKGGIEALVRSAAMELAWEGIRVNAVAPSMVKTRAAFITADETGSADYLNRVPMRRFANPDEISAAVAFLGSDESSYMTGQTMILDGGLTLGVDLPLPTVPMPHSKRQFKDPKSS